MKYYFADFLYFVNLGILVRNRYTWPDQGLLESVLWATVRTVSVNGKIKRQEILKNVLSF